MQLQQELPVSVNEIEKLIGRAWDDLKKARRDGDVRRILASERRMNALLDRLGSNRAGQMCR